MPAMSPRLALVFSAILGACSEAAPSPPDADLLVLAVGGDHGSLRQSLVAAGVPVDAAHRLRSEPAAGSPVGEQPPSESPSPPSGQERQAPENPVPPTPEPTPDPGYLVVQLQHGQTLIHLAKKYLGNPNRYRELLTFNGWSEADARRLKDGQDVKVPRAGAGAR